MVNQKRILLVDDEKSVRFVVGESLMKLGNKCEVVTARNGREALTTFRNSSFDLVITDIRMPKMDGVHLTELIRALNQTVPVVWMTAYGNETLKNKAKQMNVRHFLAKPLDIVDIREIARAALETAVRQQEKEISLPDPDGLLQARLGQLRGETGAYMILLITMSGNPVDMVGVTKELNVSTLSALVAGNFLAAHEIARLLGKESSFKLSYHESDQHNIYAYGVSEKYLLITVFGDDTKPGLVWFYAQRAVADLKNILADMKIDDQVNNSLDNIFGQDLQDVLDIMLEPPSIQPAASPDDTNQVDARIAPGKEQDLPASTLSFDEAVAQGIMPGNAIPHKQPK